MKVLIKDSSDVVNDLRSKDLFESIPQGKSFVKSSSHWYLAVSEYEYQHLYRYVCETAGVEDLPLAVRVFDSRQTSRTERKRLVKSVAAFEGEDARRFKELHKQMCHRVAQRSANIFNTNLALSLNSARKEATLERMVRAFLGMGTAPKVLAGLDSGEKFAVLMPDFATWQREWVVDRVVAEPDLDCSQSVVNFQFDLAKKESGQRYCLGFHAEVRWSRGRFSGIGSRLFKDYAWNAVPFAERLI
jgi:hypothetical protein